MSNKREKSSDTEMTFFEHIEALRPHLVRGVLALVVVMIAAFIGKKFVIDWVLMGPQSPDFPTNRWLCDFSYWVFGDNRICINQVKINMVNTALAGQFNLHMQVAFATAIAVAVPYLLWESLCFFTGLAFGYFVIAPLSISFFAGYQASPDITNMIDIRSYLTTVLSVSIACAVLFQLPLLIYFLARMGLITASFLKRYRRHALVLLMVVSAIITPPDIFSLFLVVIPLYGLYECSILLASRVERKMAREETEAVVVQSQDESSASE